MNFFNLSSFGSVMVQFLETAVLFATGATLETRAALRHRRRFRVHQRSADTVALRREPTSRLSVAWPAIAETPARFVLEDHGGRRGRVSAAPGGPATAHSLAGEFSSNPAQRWLRSFAPKLRSCAWDQSVRGPDGSAKRFRWSDPRL